MPGRIRFSATSVDAPELPVSLPLRFALDAKDPSQSGVLRTAFDNWTGGNANWIEIRALERERSIAYTTVMTTLVRLHEKGVLERRRDQMSPEVLKQYEKVRTMNEQQTEVLQQQRQRALQRIGASSP